MTSKTKPGLTNRQSQAWQTDFSADDLACLLSSPCTRALSIAFPSQEFLISLISSGVALLIPYDCDRNFEPAMKKGHSSHWAIVVSKSQLIEKSLRKQTIHQSFWSKKNWSCWLSLSLSLSSPFYIYLSYSLLPSLSLSPLSLSLPLYLSLTLSLTPSLSISRSLLASLSISQTLSLSLPVSLLLSLFRSTLPFFWLLSISNFLSLSIYFLILCLSFSLFAHVYFSWHSIPCGVLDIWCTKVYFSKPTIFFEREQFVLRATNKNLRSVFSNWWERCQRFYLTCLLIYKRMSSLLRGFSFFAIKERAS